MEHFRNAGVDVLCGLPSTRVLARSVQSAQAQSASREQSVATTIPVGTQKRVCARADAQMHAQHTHAHAHTHTHTLIHMHMHTHMHAHMHTWLTLHTHTRMHAHLLEPGHSRCEQPVFLPGIHVLLQLVCALGLGERHHLAVLARAPLQVCRAFLRGDRHTTVAGAPPLALIRTCGLWTQDLCSCKGMTRTRNLPKNLDDLLAQPLAIYWTLCLLNLLAPSRK